MVVWASVQCNIHQTQYGVWIMGSRDCTKVWMECGLVCGVADSLARVLYMDSGGEENIQRCRGESTVNKRKYA